MKSGPKQTDPMGRILAKTVLNADTGCYLFIGANTYGYGKIGVGGRSGKVVFVHNYAYERLVGPIPTGLILDHLCRVPCCWNPKHLEPVTNKENILRGTAPTAINAAATECIAGHPFDEANTRLTRSGKRHCRACHRDRQRAYYWARQQINLVRP